MNDITFCELREKEVVNVVDGKRLGRVIDMLLTCTGTVKGLIVPAERRFFKSFGAKDSIFIPWKKIKKIGEDTILVELAGMGDFREEREDCEECRCNEPRRRQPARRCN